MSAAEPVNLAAGLTAELSRCRAVLGTYESIGQAGNFVAYFIRQDIASAERAMARADTIAMMAVYKRLQEVQE